MPFSPAFHALWWHNSEGGRQFVEQLGEGSFIDEDDIVSPWGQQEEGYVVWPWEKWMTKKKMTKVTSTGSIREITQITDSFEGHQFEDLDASTPQWQRYYSKVGRRVETVVSSVNTIRNNRTKNSKDQECQTDEFVGWIPCGGEIGEREVKGRMKRGGKSVGEMFGLMKKNNNKKKKRPQGKSKLDDDDGNNKATSTEGMESELAEMAAGQPISLSSKDPAFFGLPPIEEWGAPVFVRFRNGSKININVKGDEGFCNFSTPLFEGKLSFCIADLQNSDMQSIFSGRKRRYRYVVVGKFKSEVPFDELYTGQVMKQHKKDRSTDWLMKSMRWMLKSLSPAMKETVDDEGNKVVVSPVSATAQRMCVGRDGVRSDGMEVDEDCTTLGQGFFNKKGPLNPEARKKVMCSPSVLSKHSYKTGTTYTFEFYQHLFDPLTFHMNVVGLSTLDVVGVLGRQPVNIVTRRYNEAEGGEGEVAWEIEMWHRRVFEEEL